MAAMGSRGAVGRNSTSRHSPSSREVGSASPANTVRRGSANAWSLLEPTNSRSVLQRTICPVSSRNFVVTASFAVIAPSAVRSLSTITRKSIVFSWGGFHFSCSDQVPRPIGNGAAFGVKMSPSVLYSFAASSAAAAASRKSATPSAVLKLLVPNCIFCCAGTLPTVSRAVPNVAMTDVMVA